MSEVKLLQCPFCGGEALVHTVEPHTHSFATWLPDYTGGAFIECSKCSCGISGDTEQEAIKTWNTRKPMEDIVERLEEKRKQYEILCKTTESEFMLYYRKGVMRGYEYSRDVVKEEGLDREVELTKTAPKVKTNLLESPKWIPIGQFPTEPCLLYFADGTMAVGYFDEAGDVCISVGDSYYCSSEEPIAWQPLPEPYEEEGV